jgi:hypothetical protein
MYKKGGIMDINIKAEIHKHIQSFEKAVEQRIATTVKKCIADSEKYHISQHLKALQTLQENQVELNCSQLTKKYMELYSEIANLKIKSNNYILAEKIAQQNHRLDVFSSKLGYIDKSIEKLISDKYIESDISNDELKVLYSKSQCSPDEVSKFLCVDKSRFYQILDGKESDKNNLKRKHDLKQFFLKKIYENSNATV